MQQTSAVRSSIASAKRSGGIDPSASGRTWTTSAPRSSWACAIWPTVGNSYSLITIFGRARRSSAETMPLTPCVTEVVTASSAGSACRSRANAARAASARSTQTSHSAPFSSQPSRYSSYAVADAVRERALRARVQVRRVREDRELAPDRRADLPGEQRPCAQRTVGPTDTRRPRCCSTSCGSSSIRPRRARSARSAVFSQWQPPDGADFSGGFFGFSDGTGGVALVEVDSAATLSRTIDPWTPWLRFDGHADRPDRGGVADRESEAACLADDSVATAGSRSD